MKRTLGLLVAGGTSALVTIAYLVFVARVLGPSEYGEFSAALAFIYFGALALSPLTPAIARIAARRVARGDAASVTLLRQGVVTSLAIALPVAAVMLLLPLLATARALKFQSSVPLLIALASALTFALLSADRGFLQGLFRFRAYNGSVLIESFVRLAAAIAIFRVFGQSASGALIAYLTAIVVAEIFNALLFPGSQVVSEKVGVDWAELRRMVVPMMALMVAAAAYQNVDMMAVKRWFSPVTAGEYGAAAAVAKMFGAVFTPLYVLVGPVLTQHHERGEPLPGPALRIAAIFLALSSVGFVLLLFQGEEIVRVLFGEAFTGAAGIAVHLGAISIMIHTSLLLSQVFITIQDFRFLRWFAVAAGVQVVGLAMFHATISEVVMTLYAAQLTLILPLSLKVARHARMT